MKEGNGGKDHRDPEPALRRGCRQTQTGPVVFGNPLYDGQTQSASLLTAAGQAIESFRDALHFLGGDSRPVIRDIQLNFMRVGLG